MKDNFSLYSIAFAALNDGLPLEDYLLRAREQGMTYEQLARAIFIETGGQIEVVHTTVKRWLDRLAQDDDNK